MRKFLFAAVSTFAIAAPAMAQDDGQIVFADDVVESITVTATGLDIPVNETGQPVTIVDLSEIQSVQGPDLTRVLRRLPGVTFSRNGGAGGFTGVRVRGAGSEQMLVLVDGVKVNDTGAPGGGFDFGNLLAGNVERIELLRGPNSVIWGSDAMGGVMNVSTRLTDGIAAAGEYGSNDTVYGTLSAGLAGDRAEAGVTGSFYDTDGYSASANGTEPDGFRQWQVTGRGRYWLADGLALNANGRYAEGKLEQDGYEWVAPYAFIDTHDLQDTREWSGRVGADYAGEKLTLRAGYSISDTRRLYTGESYGDYPYETKGRLRRAELFGRYDLTDALAVDFGADREWSRFADSGVTKSLTLTSGHGQVSWSGPVFRLAAGTRYDDHEFFGSEWTFGANGAVELGSDIRLRASYGEGFKAPTLYQLFSYYGDTTLSPERSRGYDVGIEKGRRDGPFFASASLFRRDSRDLIDFDLTNWVYYNIGKARAEGGELELRSSPVDALQLGLVWSYVVTEDRTSGSYYEGFDLNRRPRHAVTVSVDWQTPVGLMLGSDVRLVGDSYDDRANSVPLDGYVTVDLRASMPLSDAIEIYGRVENLFDAGYETVATYNTGGRAAYAGARLRL